MVRRTVLTAQRFDLACPVTGTRRTGRQESPEQRLSDRTEDPGMDDFYHCVWTG